MSNKLTYFGTASFAVPPLAALIQAGYETLVITVPDALVGRKQSLKPSPIKLFAQGEGLKILQPEKLSTIIPELAAFQPQFGVMAAYGKIISSEIIKLFPLGILNLHPSLLPKYRGPSPIQNTLLNGDTETAVTIIKIDEQVDHGPIVSREQCLVNNDIKYEKLENQLAQLGAELLIKTLPDYLAGKLKLQAQDNSRATFTKIIKKEDGKIDWQCDVKQIYNQFRAYHQWPGIYTIWQNEAPTSKLVGIKRNSSEAEYPPTPVDRYAAKENKTLKIIDCAISSSTQLKDTAIGMPYQENNQLFIPCQLGYLEILQLQLAGSKIMTAKEFINGYGKSL